MATGCTRGLPRVLVAALALGAPTPLLAQVSARSDSSNHETNVWVSYTGNHRWSSRFGLYLEGQLRRAEGVTAPKQLLFRPGIQYHWRERVTVSAGYAFQHSSPHGAFGDPIATPDHRAWEQVELENSAGRLTLAQRVRVEHRWQADVEAPAGAPARRAGWTYGNRARVQLRATRPLHGGGGDAAGWYVTATEEPFVRFGAGAEGHALDQNRAFIGVGHRWGEHLRVEGGYLNQYDLQPRGRGREVSHTLQIVFASSAPLGRGRER